MNPVQRALWFVESHSADPVSLESVAAACHVSVFHVTRAFAATIGMPLIRYLRARRLSEAARRLAEGAPDILQVALDAGYGSHEAFTRAFREHFSHTPEQVRAQAHVRNLSIQDPVTMTSSSMTNLNPPRFESMPARSFAGLTEHHRCEAPAGIPMQWQRFNARLPTLPKEWTHAAYGICVNFDADGNFDYLTGVQVPEATVPPPGLVLLRLPAQQYAIFRHEGHVAGIRSTISAIWSEWFPSSGREPVEGEMIERYGPEFNPSTGLGGVEIWIPIKG